MILRRFAKGKTSDNLVSKANSIMVVDFGSQTAHLIARRVGSMGVETKLIEPSKALKMAKKERPSGIIFSGGPSSIYDKGAPRVDKRLFSLRVPMLGICYGMQYMAGALGGKVEPGSVKEYGPAMVSKNGGNTALFEGVPTKMPVWMSHGDRVVALPKTFSLVGKTKDVPFAAMSDEKRKRYGVLFHPEVSHTEHGMQLLANFIKECGLTVSEKGFSVKALVRDLGKKMPEGKAICAVSGGVDSTVAAVLAAKAIGKRMVPVYIESGLMRFGTAEMVKKVFWKEAKLRVKVIQAQGLFLRKLKGVSDPEKKRKIIGELYVRLFEKEALRLAQGKQPVKYLIQGTIYSDVIESKGSKHADKIKSHHNVGGLPKKMGLTVVEPLREFYKDEVRSVGLKLGLPEEVVFLHPFPGPGQAVRIVGEVTPKRLAQQQKADAIVLEEFRRFGWYEKVFQCFPVMTGTKSTAVKGDGRAWAEVVALRAYESADIMTAGVPKLPYELLQAVASRIVNEVPEVSRVVYDITTKPPATMEWE